MHMHAFTLIKLKKLSDQVNTPMINAVHTDECQNLHWAAVGEIDFPARMQNKTHQPADNRILDIHSLENIISITI